MNAHQPTAQCSETAILIPVPPLSMRPPARFRGTYYTAREDCELARFWLRVPEDHVVGSEQNSLIFLERVAEIFYHFKLQKMAYRTFDSLKFA